MADPATDIVVMESIDKSFPGVHALQKVNFALARGEIHALVGENGAGKSTLIKILTGAERPDSGTIALDGAQVTIRSPLHAQSLGISTVYQEVNLCPNLTVAENLLLPPQVRAGGMSEHAVLELFPNLRERLGSQGTKLSGGEQQMLAIGRILRTGARLLLLDEPTEGLAPVIVQQIGTNIRRLKTEGFTILLVEHDMSLVMNVSDHITVLNFGKKIAEGAAEAIEKNQEVIDAYLGTEVGNA